MGNSISGPAATRTGGALDSFVSELGTDVTYDKSLGSARFLKTVKGRHRGGPVVIKIFIKPDPGLSLRNYHKRLNAERENLGEIPNIYNYQTFVETDRAGYIIRQWLASSLYDRISTRPFLSLIEKKWIAFQLIYGMRDARNRKISHGDIKSENVLVTTWNWVYITDFASTIKPTYLPLDDPADFSFFFDTSGRRTCYIAPERFYTAGSEISKLKAELDFHKRDGNVTEAMDVFSAGCVIAELFLEGTPTFTLSQLFKYRQGELNVENHLSSLEDGGIKSLVLSMIVLDPASRPTFETLLHTFRGSTFPELFYSFLHNYVSSVSEPSSPSLFMKPSMVLPHPDSSSSLSTLEVLPSDSDHRLERIWQDFESVEPYLALEDNMDATITGLKPNLASTAPRPVPCQDVLPVDIQIPNRTAKLRGPLAAGQVAASEDGPALIILSLVCANIRGSNLPSSKSRALDVLLAISCYLTDEAKLDRLVPYVIDLLHDDSSLIRAAALRTLIQVLILVTAITPSNASIFPDYVLPNIRHIASDHDPAVRCMYAQCLVPLADTSVRYLEMGQALKAHGTFKLSDVHGYDDGRYEVSYDASLQDLQAVIRDQLVTLLVDSSSVVKRAVLRNISSLCVFFGRQKTNDVLLSHMITYLNDPDWLLRYAFFESIVDVAACVGGRSLEEYILPLMVQALSDIEESVVAKVLSSLTSLCELGLFAQMRIWELMSATIGFLYHPNSWIRQGAAAFLGSSTKHLPSTDVWCILYPFLKHFLRSDIRSIEEQSLLNFAKPPLSRQIFDSAVLWAMKAERSPYWTGQSSRVRSLSKPESAKDALVTIRKSGPSRISSPRSEEDDGQLQKLRQLGMTHIEEGKLLALRDYIVKLAGATSSFTSRSKLEKEVNDLNHPGTVKLQKLGVVPQTVFLGLKDPNVRRPDTSRRITIESHGKRSPFSQPSSRPTHTQDGGSVDDLRKRLVSLDGSTTSLQNTTVRERRESISSLQSAVQSPTFPPFDLRSPSPADPGMGTDPSVLRRKYIHLGSTDGHKALPAVGSIKANAIGLLEAPTQLRSVNEENSPSGRSSPISAADTFRGERKARAHSSQPPFPTMYEGHDAGITNFIENIYQDTFRDPSQDFGPRIHEGAIRRRTTVRHTFSSRESNARRAEVTLIAHLASHSAMINGLAVSPDHVFFVSCSDDKTVKVWDTARLERNVTSKPRHTYAQHHTRVTAVCILEATHCFASAGADGSLHVVRVLVTQTNNLPRYSKLQVIREHRVDIPGEYITCLAHFNSDSASNLIYSTSHSSIIQIDLRSMRVLQRMENPRHYGAISCMCLDRQRTWLVVGTLGGVLSLWDIRFGLILRSWKTRTVSQSSRATQIHKCVLHPTIPHWILVTSETRPLTGFVGTVLVEVWDIEKTVLVETFTTREYSTDLSDAVADPQPVDETIAVEAEKNPATALAALVRSRTSRTENGREDPMTASGTRIWTQPDVRAIVVGRDFGGHLLNSWGDSSNPEGVAAERKPLKKIDRGFILTGSEDRKIRIWYLGAMERSFHISGAELENDKPTFSSIRSPQHIIVHSETNSRPSHLGAGRMSRSTFITQHQHSLVKSHQDCITALLCIDAPFRGGVVSGDRAGILKVYRIDID